MKYIVTGGAGFIGSHIVEELEKHRHEVVILDNLFSGKMENIAPLLDTGAVSLVRGSVTDLPLLKRTFEGAEGIFHQGAITSVPHSIAEPLATNETNVMGTLNVLVAARDCGVPKILFASSASVYGDTPPLPAHEASPPSPQSPYAVSKLTGEHYLRTFYELYGLRTVALRYFNVFGPRQDPTSEYAAVIPNFISAILDHRSPVIYGDGEQTRDFTFVKDVVQANIRAMEREAQGVFNVACNRRINLTNLAETIMDEAGISVPLRYAPRRECDVKDSLADITRARKTFGYEPRHTVKSGLKATIAWYRNQQMERLPVLSDPAQQVRC
jgi:UDP-glucose 4-epimerase